MNLIGKRNAKDFFLPNNEDMIFDFAYRFMVFDKSQMINNQ